MEVSNNMIFNLLFFLFLAQLESIFNFHRIQKDFNFWELLNIICGKTSLKGSFSLQSKNFNDLTPTEQGQADNATYPLDKSLSSR